MSLQIYSTNLDSHQPPYWHSGDYLSLSIWEHPGGAVITSSVRNIEGVEVLRLVAFLWISFLCDKAEKLAGYLSKRKCSTSKCQRARWTVMTYMFSALRILLFTERVELFEFEFLLQATTDEVDKIEGVKAEIQWCVIEKLSDN